LQRQKRVGYRKASVYHVLASALRNLQTRASVEGYR
jgi:hypothetical protein